MSREIQARCPVCGEWWTIPPSDLDQPGKCGKCQNVVTLVPRTRRTIFWRKLFAIVITLLVIAGAIWFYETRVNTATKALGGSELPDLTPRQK